MANQIRAITSDELAIALIYEERTFENLRVKSFDRIKGKRLTKI